MLEIQFTDPPQIVIHSDGKAHFSFYADDFTGTYTLTIEGCDKRTIG